MQNTAETKPKWGKFALPVLAGAVCGFLGTGVMLGADEAGLFGKIGDSGTVAMLVGMIYILMATAVAVGVASPSFGARFLNIEDADELRETRKSLISGAIGMLALGALLIIIVLGGEGSLLNPVPALVLAVVLLGVGVLASFISMRLADELMSAVSREAAAIAYYSCFACIGGWAMLAQLGFAAAPEMLDVLTLFLALVLLATFWAAGRRGLLASC